MTIESRRFAIEARVVAEQGHADAQNELGGKYEDGLGAAQKSRVGI